MPKAYIINNGEVQEFDDIQAAQRYIQENGIHIDKVINADTYKPKVPNYEDCNYSGIMQSCPDFAPMSGQERRRERRRKERKNK